MAPGQVGVRGRARVGRMTWPSHTLRIHLATVAGNVTGARWPPSWSGSRSV